MSPWLSNALTCLALLLGAMPHRAQGWLPSENPIRGVNLGGHFIIEPWMMMDEWKAMGCGDQNDEWQCVEALGQETADAVFDEHWRSWITRDDISEVVRYGLNTVRIPLGFWMKEDLVRPDEFFPRGGFPHLERLCRWARDAGLYVILDLHAAPGVQSSGQQFTGHSVERVRFFNPDNYARAYEFLEWITRTVYTNENFAAVGAIQVMNEPRPQSEDEKSTLLYEYYLTAYNRIRAAEDELRVAPKDRLHVQFMASRWGQGDPKEAWGRVVPFYAMYDDHKYLHWDDGVPATRRDYLSHFCYDDVGANLNSGDKPLLVGEWSLSPRDDKNPQFDIAAADAVSWYGDWFAAQLRDFEKQRGWVFWSWKTDWIDGRDDWRWSYKRAVEVGVIPVSLSVALASDVCQSCCGLQ